MARNLIPPPSPGGRPDPDAEQRAFHERELVAHEDTVFDEQPSVEGLEPAEKSRFSGRFGLLTGTMAGLGIAAIAVLVLVLANRPGPAPAWSAWHPTLKERDLRIVEIARFVEREYRLDDGDQLVSVDGAPLDGQNGDGLRVVARTSGQGEGADIAEIDGHTVMYTLKGLGPNGAIDVGTPSVQRRYLVQREATELALYTFKYVKNVDNVIALMPPGRAAGPSGAAGPTGAVGATGEAGSELDGVLASRGGDIPAMLYRPGDVKSALAQPLRFSLPSPTPRPSTMSQSEQAAFKSLARDHQFYASVVSDQLGGGILVLDRPPAAFDIEDSLRSIDKG